MAENRGGSLDSPSKVVNLADFAELQGIFASLAGSSGQEEWDRVIISDQR